MMNKWLRLLQQAKLAEGTIANYLSELGECDHSVGICQCELKRQHNSLKAVIEQCQKVAGKHPIWRDYE